MISRPEHTNVEGDFGIGSVSDEHFYGPVQVSCYRMESEEAIWPRVLVGPQLLRLLESNLEHPGMPEVDRANSALAESLKGYCFGDTDGQMSLDYLHKDFVAYHRTHYPGFVEAEYVHVERGLEQHGGDPKLGLKYRELHGYFASRLGPLDEADRTLGAKTLEEVKDRFLVAPTPPSGS